MLIRDASRADFERILHLNEESVHFLSPLLLARLEALHSEAAYHRVIDDNGSIAGFLLHFVKAATTTAVITSGLSNTTINFFTSIASW